jgi:hypothetical protein
MTASRTQSSRCTAAFVAGSPRMALARLSDPRRLPATGAAAGPPIVLLRFGTVRVVPSRPDGSMAASACLAPAGAASRIACVQIREISPQAVRWIRIREDGEQVYQIDTFPNGGFRLTSAGEFVEAIANMSGLSGMVIELPEPTAPASEVTIDLLVAEGPQDAARVKIDALMC